MTWVAVVLLGAGALYWFQPWRAFTDRTVVDSLAVVAATPPSGATPSEVAPSGTAPSEVARSSAPPAAVVTAQGAFVTHEHDTAGTARVVRNADGSHQLELVGLSTSDGPDLRVWLSDQPVTAGRDGWHVFDDGEHAELGRLKGNRGSQVYPIAAGVDPGDFRSVSIWCERFSVSFGAAPLG